VVDGRSPDELSGLDPARLREEPLDVRLGYDERSLYFAFRCSVRDRAALEALPRGTSATASFGDGLTFASC